MLLFIEAVSLVSTMCQEPVLYQRFNNEQETDSNLSPNETHNLEVEADINQITYWMKNYNCTECYEEVLLRKHSAGGFYLGWEGSKE